MAVDTGWQQVRDDRISRIGQGDFPVERGGRPERVSVRLPQCRMTGIAQIVERLEILEVESCPFVVFVEVPVGQVGPGGLDGGRLAIPIGNRSPGVKRVLQRRILDRKSGFPTSDQSDVEILVWCLSVTGRFGGQQQRLEARRIVVLPEVAQLLANLRLERLQLFERPAVDLGKVDRVGDQPGAAEHSEQRVVVAGRERIDFVVVTPCTGNRRGLERLGQRVDLVGEDVVADRTQPDAVIVGNLAETVEGRPDDGFVETLLMVNSRPGEQVAGDVFTDQLVEGHVLVEGADQVIPVPPGVVDLVVPLVSVSLGEMDDVHPVPRPAFTEMG